MKNDIPAEISGPAQNALEGAGITTLAQLAKFTEKEILKLHGIGPSAIPKLKKALGAQGLSFKRS